TLVPSAVAGDGPADSAPGADSSFRSADRRSQPLPPARRSLSHVPDTLRRTDCRGPGERTRLGGGAAARRGAGRDRSREDGVLLEREPRVPYAADADARTDRGRARQGRRHAARRSRDGLPQRAPSPETGELAARLLEDRSRTD